MESEKYSCSNEEAKNLGNILYKIAKDNDTFSSGCYSSVPEVMLCVHRHILSSYMGLDFNYYDTYNLKYRFTIVDEKKFLVARIKYGI